MKHGKLIKQAARLAEPFCVTKGEKFRLKDYDPSDTTGVKSKEHAQEILDGRVGVFSRLQEKLYAQDRWAVLIVLQALDAAGKDGVVKHVMSGVNPQGCEVFSFKAPSSEELDHDYLWRTHKCVPARGKIGIFNRSYYEEVLVVRVHPELLAREKLPRAVVSKDIWKERFEDIVGFERYMARNGTLVLKFFLHVSRGEQRRRFLERLDKPAKNWKFSAADLAERARWNDYMHAYEEMIQHTATARAPWYVVPADHKWFTRLVVVEAIVAALDRLELAFPEVPPGERKALKAARAELQREGDA